MIRSNTSHFEKQKYNLIITVNILSDCSLEIFLFRYDIVIKKELIKMGVSNERIYLLRTYKGFSIQDISSVLKIDEKKYKQYENNKKLKLSELHVVADVLDVSTDYLIGRIDWPIPVIDESNVKIIQDLRALSAEKME